MNRRGVLALAACTALPARAAQVLRIVVAYPPGGVSDRIARVLAQRLGPQLRMSVVVENRPGAGGGVALASLAQVPAGGRVLAFSAISPLALSPHLGAAAPAVQPVTGVMHTPLLLVGTPALDADDFAGMLRQARASASKLRWATSGVGTIGHLGLEQVCRAFGIEVVHVPYAGGGPQLRDALAGRFELLSTNLAPQQVDYVRQGRLVPLALGSPSRSPLLPTVPTFAEVGAPQANLTSLFGLFAPPSMPAAEVARFNQACRRVLDEPEFARLLAQAGNIAAGGTQEEFAREIERQSEANRRLVAAPRR
ncbi:Bug family tripartite tricarboxylate transporter substrate binding protein [Ramlibacter sp. Leaf400]|uniref:Bug family tripartite tricarboxylate transporter substrate binding protein n=1 Tax=Ramlibacter sp. Leaf400 TaxID=1736365 RepID=UPI000AF86C1A|nr:tripartite tricarboxylate transporter substrate binding protein [Ramlibacter sp. Leaf400]